MSNSIAPFPYKMPYIDSIQPGYFSDVGYSCYWSGRALRPIDSDTHSAWPLLDIILTGIDQIAERDGWSAIFSTIARLEFVWDEDQSLRGVAIFDSRGQLVVHVVHALLGYSGNGPTLSEQITTHLGVSPQMFEEIQCAVWNQRPYKVIVSRRKHGMIQGVDTDYPTLEVEPTWTWWRAR